MQRPANSATPQSPNKEFDPYQNDGETSPMPVDRPDADAPESPDEPVDLIHTGVTADDAGMLDGGLTGNQDPER